MKHTHWEIKGQYCRHEGHPSTNEGVKHTRWEITIEPARREGDLGELGERVICGACDGVFEWFGMMVRVLPYALIMMGALLAFEIILKLFQ
ncbi:MAG: hypothetical protein LBS59_09180 [Puniceicoccales bacterium]|jgi:hypothetical protein|nr:hypothetical protein [Puniceicoccales bacterium]